ncbi:hypothetical protein UFOVP1300_47 [uncultured Caudovirales phage]|uniref:Uncharacterized protein n=1 Tax=uncultured Caudovirales phage TaxID=2100421 RepID=A0A6J5Q7Y7_9CAUD|nr:hypothetical protein UFOVP1068_2 [uncultured Caudovirales phage]CAB4195950.1 hypothetical protein UFOVP1300_47 [uncultured Caudovirales phage]
MSAVVDFVEDVVGGVVEAVGDVVESVVDVVKDVGRAIDDYVIQPILDDPLSAIATVAAASFLGPGAAAMFGTSASVGVGIAAGAANAAAGLVQGEDFGEAIKGGLMAGVGAGVGAELFGGAGAEAGTPAPTDALDDFLAANNNFVDVPMDALASAPTSAVTSPVDLSTPMGTDLPVAPSNVDVSAAAPTTPAATPSPLESITPPADAAASAAATPSPLQSLNTTVPQVEMPTFTSGLDTSFTPDYNLTSGMQSGAPGFKLPDFTPADSFDIYGNANYSLTPQGMSGGPGLQLPDAPNLARMGGGQGLTADVSGLPEFRYSDASLDPSLRGQTDTWQSGGKTYGAATPDVTVSQTAITPTPQTITYDATTNMGTPSVMDQLASGNIVDAAKTVGSNVVDWTKNANPWVLGAGALAATSALGGAGGPPSTTPPPKGSTQDSNFTKSLDLYQYMRDKANYGGDLTKYGQVGQSTPGEHQFFQNTKFVPVPIPGQPATPAKMGGLIQMKHFAQGGMAQGMQDPRRAQMMAAMAQQRPAGQGGPMGMAQGRPPMMQGGAMPQRPMSPQNAQGMQQQQRPQMPQRPRDPKMAYYQYGNPPTQAKAMGGLSQVHSMKIGGGADGRSDDVNAVLSDGEYVMDAETVAMLGNGSSKAGAAKLDQMRSKLRQHKGKNLASGKISPNAKSPLAYLKGA